MQFLPPTCFPYAMLGYAPVNTLTSAIGGTLWFSLLPLSLLNVGFCHYLVYGQVLQVSAAPRAASDKGSHS